MKKISMVVFLLLFGMILSAAGEKMSISGQKKADEVVEKDGVYTISPSGRTRIQLYPKGAQLQVYPEGEIEVTADVSGSGNIQLGLHLYNRSRQWKNSIGSKVIRVDAEESETVKAVLKTNRQDIVSVLPWISVFSGKVKVENLSVRLIGALDSGNLASAPKLPGWSYGKNSKAMKCVESDGKLMIVTGRQQTVEMFSGLQAAKNGDVFQISGDIAGKGRLIAGLHLYSKGNVWVGTSWAQMPLKDGKVEKWPEITVKTPAGKPEVAFYRLVFRVTPSCKVTFKDVKAVKKP